MKLAIRFTVASAAVLSSLLLLAADAPAELAPWDQTKVTELAKQLDATSNALFQAFRREPPPARGTPTRKRHFELRQNIRMIRRDARSLSRALAQGEDQEATEPIYRSLMQNVRSAQQNAQRQMVQDPIRVEAQKALDILNQLAPFYDPNAQPLQPTQR